MSSTLMWIKLFKRNTVRRCLIHSLRCLILFPMSKTDSRPNYELSLADCEICCELSGVETSFSKYGWPDSDQSMDPAASRLELAESIEGDYRKENHHVKRCPLCGTYYQYDYSYEYLVNGSEDEEELTRLTPTQARRFIEDETYDLLLQKMERNLNHDDIPTRRYAARSLASHYLELGDMTKVRTYLTPDTYNEVLRGILYFFWNCEDDHYKVAEIAQLKDVLKKLRGHADENIAAISGYVLKGIK